MQKQIFSIVRITFIGLLFMQPFSLGVFSQSIPQNEPIVLTVILRGIKYNNTIRVGVFTSEKTFLKEAEAMKNYSLRPNDKQESVKIDITDLPPGEYALAIYQDINEDNRFNRNFLGIPTEPYGVSNNVKPMFAPPSYEECRFQFRSSQTKIINLVN
ncbi:MAG: DUF2141 domain-containing protein [Candidatus Kapaibacteriota bacterium]|jgi:uncharacterized protein (DUF2141 family)